MAHILVVDDDEIMQDLISFALEMADHTVSLAGDGQQALQRLAQETPDLMIVDLHMPVMDGVRFLTEAAQQFDAVPPSLVLSASSTNDVRDRLLALGAVELVRKPVDTSTLTERVRQALAKSARD